MSDQRTETLQAELESALRKRARLDAVIDWLQEELGVGVPTDPDRPDGPGGGGEREVSPTADVTSLVSEGEFFGMTGPKATVALLERVGRSRPLKTEEIFNAIVKGGVKVKDRQGFYRTLFRDQRFLKVARSTWGLSAWYPESARKAAKAGQDEADGELDDTQEPEPVAGESDSAAPNNGSTPPSGAAVA